MIFSVERRRTFADFRTGGLRARQGVVRLSFVPVQHLAPGGSSPQVAFAIGRSFGGAVERNRGRRRLRAAFVEAWRGLIPERADRLAGAYLLSGSRSLLSAPFRQLVADIDGCFERVERGLGQVTP